MRLTGTPPAYLINRMPSHEVRSELSEGVCRAGLQSVHHFWELKACMWHGVGN